MSAFANLQAFSPLLRKCSACGLCLPACPTFTRTGIETDGPRGRLLLASSLLSGAVSPAQAASAFAGCLLCGRCDRACPAHIPLTRIFFALRPGLPLQLAHNRLFRSLSLKANIQDFLQPPLSLLNSLLRKTHGGKLGNLPIQPFRQETASSGKAENAVLLFAGCITRRFFPDLAHACVAALEKHGCKVIASPELVCCGRPLAVQGQSLLPAIRRNLAVLSAYDFRHLVTPCPGCLATFRQVWPDARGLSEAEQRQIADLAAKCMDINEFLAQREPESAISSARGIWWHPPCLMTNAENAAAKKIIREAGEILDVQVPACCGAPLFCLKNPVTPSAKHKATRRDLLYRLTNRGISEVEKPHSRSLAAAIRQNARNAHADCIAVACPGCKLAIQYGRSGQHEPPVLHSIEIYMRKRGSEVPW